MIVEVKEKSEITIISNKYKDSHNDLIDSLDTKSLVWPDSSDWPKLID